MTSRRFAYVLSLAILLALPASAQAGGQVASATGVKQVKGKTLYVDVVVAVPAGQTARHATDRALSEQGAARQAAVGRRPGRWQRAAEADGEQYFYNGLKWSPPTVTQNYNGADAPIAAQTALVNTYSDWSSVTGSTYRISSGGTTTRCPSLVKECPAPRSMTRTTTSAGPGSAAPHWASRGSPRPARRPTWRSTRTSRGRAPAAQRWQRL